MTTPKVPRRSHYVRLTPRGLFVALTASSAALAALSTLSYAIENGSRWIWLHHAFKLDDEWALPKWFAVGLLASAAWLLVRITGEQFRAGAGAAALWALLAAVFAVMALDETVSIHEALGNRIQERYQPQGLFTFGWVIPASIGVLLFGGLYLRFLWSLPAGVRWRFVLGLGVYVTGALGMEMVTGALVDPGNLDKRTSLYIALSTLEETLEMLGASLVVVALYLRAHQGSAAPSTGRAVPYLRGLAGGPQPKARLAGGRAGFRLGDLDLNQD